MSLTRRSFVAGLGGVTLTYAFNFGCSRSPHTDSELSRPRVPPDNPGVDFRDWLVISSDGSVSVFTSRTEMGQGLTTVLSNLVCQGLDLPPELVHVVLGDTDRCPSDGPTTGSAATFHVGWAFWVACHEVRDDLVLLAAEVLDRPPEELHYAAGEVRSSQDPSQRIGIGDFVDGRVRRMNIDPQAATKPMSPYLDKGTLSVHAEAIVTGMLQYTGDLYPEGCLYGGYIVPGFHKHVTRLVDADLSKARGLPGVVKVDKTRKWVVAVGKSFTVVQRALDAVEAVWEEPSRPRQLDNEREIRAGAQFVEVMEEKGEIEPGMAASEQVVTETYITQYASQVPLETDTAVAKSRGDRTSIWLGTQHPFLVRYKTADRQKVPESQVHVIGMPMGGAFGSKVGHVVGPDAARLAKLAGAPVKYVYSRLDDIQRRGRYKDSVIVDISTGVTSDGRLRARKVELYQDEGHGTVDVYDIPHVLTRLYKATTPIRHATMRGTSYAQTCFALESHTDVVAAAVGLDPIEFRKKNVALAAFRPLLDTCAEMMGYGQVELPANRGVGFGLCNHGGRQLGVVGAEVAVNRKTGKVTVIRLGGAYDIGQVINRNTLRAGVKGAMLWGLGYALLEEIKLDGHRCYTTGFSDYRIARFSDTPPIDLAFLDNLAPGVPRGCGELPLPPTIAAICNAVYNAIGVRFHTLPMTSERVKAALLANPIRSAS